MCGIAGYSLAHDSSVERIVAARALLTGIAERGADAVGYAYRAPGEPIAVYKQRSGATALLKRISVPVAQHRIERAEPEMTVDSEIIFALAELSRGRTAEALQQLYGSMATAWLDEGRSELVLARGLGRPLWIGHTKNELFFASTRIALELVESYVGIKLRKSELPEGTVVTVESGKIVARESFQLDRSFEEEPLPAVRAPHEGRACLEHLARLHAATA